MSSTEFGNISFDLPKNQSNVIKVIGVGGGGSNAINHMFQQGIKGVDFVICNTDAQALENSPVPNKIQLGVSTTEGLGAGADPQVGEKAAVESFDDIKGMLNSNTKMVFVTAGMGGGTGTGAAPIIAKQAKDMGILTVGIVTIPFQFEGRTRNEQAQVGVENLRNHCDSLIVINNNKLREVYGNLGFKAGFSKADEVLATASRGIAEVITHHYTQNIDLRDAKTVLSNSGTAIMGSAQASGANRATDAISKALDSPLLNDNKITGAKNVLLLIISGSEEITIDEIGEISDHIQAEAGHSANIIMGVGEDESLDESISVTIIATGFDVEQQNEIVNTEAKKIIHTLEDEQRAEHELSPKKTSSTYQPAPKKEEEKKIVHTLSLEEEEEDKEPESNHTSEEVRNMAVDYEEVEPSEDEFIITDAVNDIEVTDPEMVEPDNQEQFMFTFDFPKNQEEQQEPEEEPRMETPKQQEPKKVVHRLFDEESDSREQNKPKERAAQRDQNGVTRYSLSDYMEVEEMLNSTPKNTAPKKEEKQPEPEMSKPAYQEPQPAKPAPKPEKKENQEEDDDPFNNPINETLVKRAAERRAKMKEFNYKFRNNISKIDEIEKQPAYKRQGINLDNSRPGEEKISRTSLNTGDDDEIRFRTNNSFLHDNVD
ncbi:cell division protein FtsZ [Salinimicrobium catena]|uniref:Cell division protein FtsZ n=1 Tax=Salinimicrobium catena TaxID=390640 RepID=A0A1H5P1J9_9FLAO|nr:cell division protein FtsZ [Salinimicrobium catena]SDL64015.1 cell division protein FtsZ [Salinimicrobium catena]SEF06927.1 cell division protein FtsZ [Salinimicrobium catena]